MPKTLQQTRRPARLIFGWVLLAGLIVAGTPASAKVYASRKEAVAEAFPELSSLLNAASQIEFPVIYRFSQWRVDDYTELKTTWIEFE